MGWLSWLDYYYQGIFGPKGIVKGLLVCELNTFLYVHYLLSHHCKLFTVTQKIIYIIWHWFPCYNHSDLTHKCVLCSCFFRELLALTCRPTLSMGQMGLRARWAPSLWVSHGNRIPTSLVGQQPVNSHSDTLNCQHEVQTGTRTVT